MPFKLAFIALFSIFSVSAQDVDLSASPNPAVVGENVVVRFSIALEDDTAPSIEFNAINLREISKTLESQATETSIINGVVKVQKRFVYAYEFEPLQEGQAMLTGIKVEVGGRKKTIPNFNLRVSSEPQGDRPFFIVAEVDKTRAYLGESIVLRYYLYKKVAVSNFEIRKFPKLENFLKRFKQENVRNESVEYQGSVYERTVLYTAQLFPEQVGTLRIDPMKVKVKYPVRNPNDPFGNFGLGLGLRNLRSRTLSSKTVEIRVLPVPSENVPPSFSGLVGEHSFDLSLSKKRFLVNEPVELTLSISGIGALENFDAPVILQDTRLEEFETNAELTLNPDFTASKRFEYTFLARSALDYTPDPLSISYFDPVKEEFVTKTIEIPALSAAGTGASSMDSTQEAGVQGSDSEVPLTETQASTPMPRQKKVAEWSYLAPEFGRTQLVSWWVVLSALFLLSSVALFGRAIWRDTRESSSDLHRSRRLLKALESASNYEEFHRALVKEKRSDRTPREVIDGLDLSPDHKQYFLGLLSELEKSRYAREVNSEARKIPDKRKLKRLVKAIFES